MLDLGRTDDVGDVYGEIRVIRQTEKEIKLPMVDYGSAFVDGAYRDVVQCPTQRCAVVVLENGTRVGSRPLPKGRMMTLPLESEVIIQPGGITK